MFLKSLEIFGFKSFADKTRIEFADGVTALLGPNGCGKSNVVDSIKWVLGEQATKSLRAEAMEDVIFNGTEARRALNVAEVALTLANDTGLLPVGVPEVVVKRRLYRSGESEYFINNTPVKLKELRELFFDTGIGKSAYSIMEQGKIDQVLSTKPEERRHLFEEAASITKYKARGAEAERKLERTDENLRQVEGILGEVTRNYENLRKQADKTTRYRLLRDEIFKGELALALIRLRESFEERAKRQKSQEELLVLRDGVKGKIDGINETLETSMGEVNSMEGRMLETQKSLYALELDKNNNENQIRLFAERVSEIKQKLAAEQARVDSMTQKLTSIAADNAERGRTMEDLGRGIADVDSAIGRLEASMEAARTKIAANDEAISQHGSAVTDLEALIETLREALRELTDHIVSQLDASLGDGASSGRDRTEAEARLRSEINAMRVLLEGKLRLLGDAVALGEGAGARAIEAASDALAEGLEALGRVETSFEGFRRAIPSFLDDFLAPEGTLTSKRDLDTKIANAVSEISQKRRLIEELRDERETLAARIIEYRDNLEEFRVSKVRLSSQLQAITEQRDRALAEAMELGRQRDDAQAIMAEDEGRVRGLEERMAQFSALKAEQITREAELRKSFEELEKGIHTRNKTLLSKERELKDYMVQLGTIQERLEKAQVLLAETLAEIKNMYANFRDKHSRDLGEFEDQIYETRDDPKVLREQLQTLRDELRTMGGVNLMALEEYAEAKERYDFLHGQLGDLRKAKEDLLRVTKEIRDESSTLFLETYEKIRKNFHTLFRRLFGGGRAELKLSDPEQVLDSGIEIYAQPPGKKLENIALLSGGEKSLTAVALLFATYMVKPSPFCLLDEIDAALDESNVGRFVGMLMDFAHTSQFIVITHNKKTVTGASTLLGVTMQESGVSKVVSIRISEEQRAADYKKLAPDPEE